MTPEPLPPGHRRFVLSRPPKAVDEMTDEELNGYATSLYIAIATQHIRPHTNGGPAEASGISGDRQEP